MDVLIECYGNWIAGYIHQNKSIKDLNIKNKTIKVIKENTGEFS